MGLWERLRASALGQATDGGKPNPADERSPLEQELIGRLQGALEAGNAPLRLHLRFTGRVQGVGFRWNNASVATALGLTGWVRNLMDGSVEMEIQGEPGKIIGHLDRLHAGYRNMRCRIWLDQVEDMPLVDGEAEFSMAN